MTEAAKKTDYGRCANGEFYKLSHGETLSSVAAQYSITLARLLLANPHLDPTDYLAGQIIIIPDGSFVPPECKTRYEVTPEDGICDLLRKFDMSFTELRALNPTVDLFSLKGGEMLVIREPRLLPRTGCVIYIMQKGEDLSAVCRRFSAREIDLLRLNPRLRPLEFKEGARVIVPSA